MHFVVDGLGHNRNYGSAAGPVSTLDIDSTKALGIPGLVQVWMVTHFNLTAIVSSFNTATFASNDREGATEASKKVVRAIAERFFSDHETWIAGLPFMRTVAWWDGSEVTDTMARSMLFDYLNVGIEQAVAKQYGPDAAAAQMLSNAKPARVVVNGFNVVTMSYRFVASEAGAFGFDDRAGLAGRLKAVADEFGIHGSLVAGPDVVAQGHEDGRFVISIIVPANSPDQALSAVSSAEAFVARAIALNYFAPTTERIGHHIIDVKWWEPSFETDGALGLDGTVQTIAAIFIRDTGLAAEGFDLSGIPGEFETPPSGQPAANAKCSCGSGLSFIACHGGG